MENFSFTECSTAKFNVLLLIDRGVISSREDLRLPRVGIQGGSYSPVSCRIASPIELRPGDVNYTSGETPSINDIRPARWDNVRPPQRKSRPKLIAQTIVG